MIRRFLRRLLFAQERIEMPDGETYVRHWPVSEKQPRPDGRWRRLGKKDRIADYRTGKGGVVRWIQRKLFD